MAFIEGELAAKTPTGVVLDNGGVGYAIFTTLRTQAQLETNQRVRLLVCEQIREDCHDLYGFLDEGSKQLFEFLRKVNGVGPKMALNLMDIGDLAELQLAIIDSDKKYLSSASGVGPKLAERISLELKDKLEQVITARPAGDADPGSSSDYEALAALQFLGLNTQQAKQALEGVDEALATEEKVKQALRQGRID